MIAKDKRNHLTILKIVLLIILNFIIGYFLLFHPITILTTEFNSDFTDEDKVHIAREGEEETGYLIWGNYMTLNKGKYEVVLHGVSEKDNLLDIYCYINDETYYSGVVQPEKEVVFNLDEKTDGVEIRIFYQGNGALAIDSISIRKIGGFGCWCLIIVLNLVAIIGIFGTDKITNPIIKRIVIELTDIILIIVSSLFWIFCMEAILRSSFGKTILWIEKEYVYYLATGFFIAFAIWGIKALNLFDGGIIYFLTGVICEILALVEYNFYIIRGEAFTFAQLSMAGEAAEVLEKYAISLPWQSYVMIFWTVCITIFAFITENRSDQYEFEPWKYVARILCFSSACVIVAGVISHTDNIIRRFGGDATVYIAKNYYDEYGYVFGLISTYPVKPTMPQDYTEATVEAVVGELENRESASRVSDLPDIIFIQEESLFDLSLVEEKTWEEDPLEKLRELQEEYISGTLLVPTVGGGTCNVEYEFLTGYPYSNTGGVPYIDMIGPKTYSIVEILENAGYQTVAMHPNTGSFFNRKNVYKYLGFDDIFFSENMVERNSENEINGWATDKYLFNIFRDYYENTREDDAPLFAHIVTAQNHGGYDYVYMEHGIQSGLKEDDSFYNSVNTFLNLEKESCTELEKVLQYLEDTDRKVIVVYWGDHAPGFQGLGIESKDTTDYFVSSHSTPLLIWNNYGLKGEELGVIAAYKVPPYVLKMAGIETDSYMNYMNENEIPNVVGEIEVYSSGEYSVEGNPKMQEIWKNLWILQYDRMFGKRYSLK